MSGLAGRRVLIARAEGQGGELAAAVARAGGRPERVAVLRIGPPADPAAAAAALAAAREAYAWIYVSRNAVAGAVRLLGGPGLPEAPWHVAVGPSTAAALRDAGARRVLQPAERYDSEGVLALEAMRAVAGRRVLLLRGQAGRDLLPAALAARGAEVTPVEVYRRIPEPAALRGSAAPDWVVAGSIDAVAALVAGAEADWRGRPLVVPGVRCAERARALGWTGPVIAAANATDAALFAALAAAADERGAPRG